MDRAVTVPGGDAVLGILKKARLLAWIAAWSVAACACADAAESPGQQPPGGPCALGTGCVEGSMCVAAADTATGTCERRQIPYGFLVDQLHSTTLNEARGMAQGVWRMPRDPELEVEVEPYAMALGNGEAVRCLDEATLRERDCLVPIWSKYYGRAPGSDLWVMPNKYDRFFFYALRPLRHLFYAYQYMTDQELLGGDDPEAAPTRLSAEQHRRNMRNTLLAVIDSFIERGNMRFALPEDPDPEGAAGYRNPNRVWAPELDDWDPASNDASRTDMTVAVPNREDLKYHELRESIWDRHGCAFRALILGNGYQMMRELLSDAQRTRWLEGLVLHADAIALPSGQESQHNHGITEGAALLYLGHVFAGVAPEIIPESLSDAWFRLGRARLNDCIQKTVSLEDGVQKEQSPFYHNYQLAFLLQILAWVEVEDIDLSTDMVPNAQLPEPERMDYDAALEPERQDINTLAPNDRLMLGELVDSMMHFSTHITQPNGLTPTIGSSVPQNFARYLDQVFVSAERDPRDVTQKLAFVRSQGELGRTPSQDELVQVFKESGFVVFRDSFADTFADQTQLVFNTAPPSHGHAHLDALSLHLYGAGQTVLIDPGWYSYDREQRHFFDSTRAHNTVTVDLSNECSYVTLDKVQDPDGDEDLGNCADIARDGAALGPDDPGYPAGTTQRGLTVNALSDASPWAYQSAIHGLYAGVSHRRALLMLGKELLVVVDQLRADPSAASHSFMQTWHLASELEVSDEETEHGGVRSIVGSAGDEAKIALHVATLGKPPAIEHRKGECYDADCLRPSQGWIAVEENHMAPAPAIEVTRQGQRADFVTVIALGAQARLPVELSVDVSDDGAEIVLKIDEVERHLELERIARGDDGERASIQ